MRRRPIPIPGLRPEELPQVPYEDLNREMFNFATPTPPVKDLPDELLRTGPPDPGHAPPIGTMKDPPYGAPPYYPSLVHLRCPPWQCPDIYSDPYHPENNVCIPWYEIDYPVLNFKVGDTRIVTITGMSYEFDQSVTSDNDIFVIRLLRGGIEMARFEEFVVNNAAANPADRYAFGGHTRPIPVMGARFDKNEAITVTVRPRGPRPFSQTSADPYNGNVKIILEGWVSPLRDTRDGAPKYLTDGVYGRTSMKTVVESGEEIYHDLEEASE